MIYDLRITAQTESEWPTTRGSDLLAARLKNLHKVDLWDLMENPLVRGDQYVEELLLHGVWLVICD
jgi:hypothetical protein